jgi:hypothetical protein
MASSCQAPIGLGARAEAAGVAARDPPEVSEGRDMSDVTHQERERALVRFKDALVDFSDDPSPDNLERYLQASRELDATGDGRTSTRAEQQRRRAA